MNTTMNTQNNRDILAQLTQVLDERKTQENNDGSYVAQLYRQGLNKILEKVSEECTETLLAAKDLQQYDGDGDGNEKNTLTHALIHETADLWFHSMVLLSHLDIDTQSVLDELARRFGLSGLEEKAQREKT